MLFLTSLQTSRNTTYLFTVYTQTQLADNLNPIRRLATLANAAAENNQEEQDIEKGVAAAECFPMQSRTSVTVEDESGGGDAMFGRRSLEFFPSNLVCFIRWQKEN